MREYKTCVYAICKNEEAFVNRWYESIKDSDYICVLDTGSTDETIKELEKYNIYVKRKIFKPWRFDDARNESLKLIPEDADICICLDLDEVLSPGWKQKLTSIWDSETTRVSYTYNWSIDENNNPIVSFFADKIHSNHAYKWTHPVHEILEYIGDADEKRKCCEELIINHYPDNSKSRSSYLPLLELSIKEDPFDDRNMHYLGREYMYYGKWNESIDTLIKHLNLKTATWKDERCASMRFIARCYIKLNRYDEAYMWLLKAINEAPYLRDPFVDMAILKYITKQWDEVIKYANAALKIKNNPKTYINEPTSYNETLNDLLSIAYFYLGDIEKAIENAKLALMISPNNERIEENLKMFEREKR